MDSVYRLKVSGRYENIPLITEVVAEAARAAGLDEDAVCHCQMAVDEACTNIIEHAYGGEGIGDIEVTCHTSPGKCTISILDTGRPFDPDNVPQPQITDNLDELRPGGVGLYLMRNLMDDVQFHFSEQGTTLVMVKTGERLALSPQPLSVPVHKAAGDIWVVTLPVGRLDNTQAPALEATLAQLVAEGHTRIVVDMSQVTYIASRGLKSLVTAWREAHDRGGEVVLNGITPRVLSVLEVVGFTQVFSIYPTLDEALSMLGAASPK